MIDVSIPCEKCRQPVRFGPAKCPACGNVPSRDARLALRERLVASSADFRELQDQISSARTVLLILAAVYAGYGLLGFLAQARDLVSTAEDTALAIAGLVENILIGIVFMGAWRAARSAPLPAIAAATLLWLALQVLGAVAVSMSIFAGLWIKAVAVILLGRGILASVNANRYLRRLRETPPAAESATTRHSP